MKKHQTAEWAVIGAGPAGIAAVGKLIDHGVLPADIIWVDPLFKVGDLGTLWSNVSSNTVVSKFTDFLDDAAAFSYRQSSVDFSLNTLSPDSTCLLSEIAKPLQWVTHHLSQQVTCIPTQINAISLSNRAWVLSGSNQTLKARHVILATGSVPRSLNHPGMESIPFEIAIDKNKLQHIIKPHETYAVFGASHSAIIIIQHLIELGMNKVINFYRSPCRYAINMGDWILYDNTGLKGHTAEFARTHIDGCLPKNLTRFPATKDNISKHLPFCDKAIYAVGFERRNNIAIDGYVDTHYDPHHGIIAPGLFGLGIAYPEKKADPFGQVEEQVGLWKFMCYLNKVLPLWFKYPA